MSDKSKLTKFSLKTYIKKHCENIQMTCSLHSIHTSNVQHFQQNMQQTTWVINVEHLQSSVSKRVTKLQTCTA